MQGSCAQDAHSATAPRDPGRHLRSDREGRHQSRERHRAFFAASLRPSLEPGGCAAFRSDSDSNALTHPTQGGVSFAAVPPVRG